MNFNSYKLFIFSLLIAFGVELSTLEALVRHADMTDQQMEDLGALPQFGSVVTINGCSGTMLNNEWAIYASHCVGYNDDGRRVTVRYKVNGEVVASRMGTVYVLPLVSAYPNTQDSPALVKLDTPMTEIPSWLAPFNGFDETGRIGWQTGQGLFGAPGLGPEGLNSPNGFFRAVSQRVTGVVSEYIRYSSGGSPLAENPNPDTTRYEGTTAPGDSGGAFFIYSRGRMFNIGTVYGILPTIGLANNRLSTRVDQISQRAELESSFPLDFAYPVPLQLEARWVAEDLSLANGALVSEWTDRVAGLSFRELSDGITGSPAFKTDATPTGMNSVTFDGNDALSLLTEDNPIAGKTAVSVAIVFNPTSSGSGTNSSPFGTSGLLDVSSGLNAWGLSFSRSNQIGWSIQDQTDSVVSVFQGDSNSNQISRNNWHVLVATWDGSEIGFDNSGDDKNIKLFINSLDQVSTAQGAYHFNVDRGELPIFLGKSQTNAESGFIGEIAEVRMYSGELQMHEIDRLMTSLRSQYISGSPDVVFERPWSDRVEVELGSNLSLRGELTGGATSASWQLVSGPGQVVFSNLNSPTTDMTFDTAGSYQLRITASNGSSTGFKDVFVDVISDSFTSTDVTRSPVVGNWIHSEIGQSSVGGSYTENTGVITVDGLGLGLGVGEGETYDHGQFVWKAATGDFDWVARIDSMTNPNANARVGIMLRAGPGPLDATAFLGVSPSGTVYTLFREQGGIWGTLVFDDNSNATLPVYLKLERRGDTVLAYRSTDGVSYTLVSQGTVLFPGIVRSGYFVTSGNDANAVSASFSQASMEQIGFTRITTAVVTQGGTVDYIDLDPDFIGAYEPWSEFTSESGPFPLSFVPTNQGNLEVYRSDIVFGGEYQSRLSIDDGSTLSFAVQNIQASKKRFDFNIDNDFEGWTSKNVNSFAVVGGALSGTAATGDPQLIITGLSIDGNAYEQFVIRLKSSINGPVKVFWGRNGADSFSADRSLELPYSGNGEMQTLVYDVSDLPEWTGRTITRLRIDPIDGVSGSDASFMIDYIEFSNVDDSFSELVNSPFAGGQPFFEFVEAFLVAFLGETSTFPNAFINGANPDFIGVNSSSSISDPNVNAINDLDGVAGGADQERLAILVKPDSYLSGIEWNFSRASGDRIGDGVSISGFLSDPGAVFTSGANSIEGLSYLRGDGTRTGVLRFKVNEFSSEEHTITFTNPEATNNARIEISVAGLTQPQFAIKNLQFSSKNSFLYSQLFHSGAELLEGASDNLSGTTSTPVTVESLDPLIDISDLSVIIEGDSGSSGGFVWPENGAAPLANPNRLMVGRDHNLDADRSTSKRGFQFDFTIDDSLTLRRLVLEVGHATASGQQAGGVSNLVYRLTRGSLASPVTQTGTIDYSGSNDFQKVIFDLSGNTLAAGQYRMEIYQTNFVGTSAYAVFDSFSIQAEREIVQTPAIANGSFEKNTLDSGNGYVSDNEEIISWSLSDNSRGGLNPSRRSPFANNGAIPDGSNVMFLQSLTETPSTASSLFGMTGLEVGKTYNLSYRVNARLDNLPQMTLFVDDSPVLESQVKSVRTNKPYKTVSYNFVADKTMVPLAISNTFNGDSALLLDDFKVVPVASTPKISVLPWTSDSDSGIDPNLYYTHAYNFGEVSKNTLVNGVEFIGVAGANPSVNGAFTYVTDVAVPFGASNLSGDGSTALAEGFVFNAETGILTLQGLTAGEDYRTSLFTLGVVGNVGALTISVNNELLTVPNTSFGDGEGARIDIEFTATGTSQTINLDALGSNTLWSLAVANAQLTNLPEGYSKWAARYPSRDLSDPAADADGDGIANMLEALYDTHPGIGDSIDMKLSMNGNSIRFEHPMNEALDGDLLVEYEWSTDLSSWYIANGVDGPAGGPSVSTSTSTVEGVRTVTATASEAMDTIFFRVRVSENNL